MQGVFAAIAVVLVSHQGAQAPLSDLEILGMGRKAYVQKCMSDDPRPESLVAAQLSFGEALVRANDTRLKTKSAETRLELRRLRRYMVDFSMNIMDAKSIYANPGSMITASSGVLADVEEMLQAILTGTCRARAPWSADAIGRNIDIFEREFKRSHKIIDSRKLKGSDTRAAIDAINLGRKSMKEIAKIASHRPSTESNWIFEFCNAQLDLPRQDQLLFLDLVQN